MCPESSSPSHRQSWTISDELATTIERDVVPRLLVSHRVGGLSPIQVARASSQLSDGDVERLVTLLTTDTESATDLFIERLLERGVASEAIYLDLLAPVAHRLGERWEEDACDFVEVSIALGRIQRILRTLSHVFLSEVEPRDAVARVLLVGAPGDQHTLGLFMVAEFFVREGWMVEIGPPFVDQDLPEMLRAQHFDVVGFSVACDSRLSLVTREIRRVRRASCNRSVRVLVGGRVFNDSPDLVRRVGADGSATDARQAPAAAAAMLPG
jgi:MerR family transcriptional regulator, light-induced transcriptional regulator